MVRTSLPSPVLILCSTTLCGRERYQRLLSVPVVVTVALLSGYWSNARYGSNGNTLGFSPIATSSLCQALMPLMWKSLLFFFPSGVWTLHSSSQRLYRNLSTDHPSWRGSLPDPDHPPTLGATWPRADPSCIVLVVYVQGFSSWLSKNRDENPRMRALLVAFLSNWVFPSTLATLSLCG